MRQIDTNALSRVAPALGVGNPITATQLVEFDDGLLQQTLDVSRMLPGSDINDGWRSVLNLQTHVANGVIFSTYDPYGSGLVPPRSHDTLRAWVMDVQLQHERSPGDGILTDALAAVRRRGIQLVLQSARAWDTQPIETGGTFSPPVVSVSTLEPAIQLRLPQLLQPGGDLLLQRSEAEQIMVAGPVRCQFMWLLWVGPRGLNPPGVA